MASCYKLFLSKFYSTRLSSGPLDHVKVLDLTRIVAGPYCTMLLGDLGAQIYKIEVPGTGDESRLWPPYIHHNKDETTCYFASLNRNKKSICVNLKSSKGIEIIKNLAQKCDVLIENFVPGKLDSMGLGYDKIKQIAPHVVYCSITGFGSRGIYKDRMGYDIIAASIGGLMHITGPKNGEPCKVGVAMTDISTGLYAHGAILAGLIERSKTGKGQKIDCDLLSTQVSCLINIGANYLNAGKEAVRWGTEHESIVLLQSFKTSDGYISIGTGNNAQFISFCQRLNLPELSIDERFQTNQLRVKNRDALLSYLEPYFIDRSTTEILQLLEGAPFPYGPVNTIQQVFNDPHIKDIGLIKETIMNNGTKIKMVGPPVEFSEGGNTIRTPPPDLGQHTTEVLSKELGLSNDTINKLIHDKVIQCS